MTTWTVKRFTQQIKEIIDNRYDCFVVITGRTGVGKSTLGVQCMRELIGPQYFTREGFEKYNIYRRGELNAKLKEFPKKSAFLVDEAINLLFNREFQNKQQNEIVKKFNMYRSRFYVVFLLLPKFGHLDKAVRESSLIKFWVHVHKRGEATIYAPDDDNEFINDPWYVKHNHKLRVKGRKRYQMKTYFSNITFDALPRDIDDVYDAVKSEKRYKADDTDDLKISKKDLIRNVASINPEATSAELARWLKTNPAYIREVVSVTKR